MSPSFHKDEMFPFAHISINLNQFITIFFSHSHCIDYVTFHRY